MICIYIMVVEVYVYFVYWVLNYFLYDFFQNLVFRTLFMRLLLHSRYFPARPPTIRFQITYLQLQFLVLLYRRNQLYICTPDFLIRFVSSLNDGIPPQAVCWFFYLFYSFWSFICHLLVWVLPCSISDKQNFCWKPYNLTSTTTMLFSTIGG